jgi:hypothetical protein
MKKPTDPAVVNHFFRETLIQATICASLPTALGAHCP